MSGAVSASPDGETRRNRRNQLVLFSAVVAVLGSLFALWMVSGGGGAPAPQGAITPSWPRRARRRKAGSGVRKAAWA